MYVCVSFLVLAKSWVKRRGKELQHSLTGVRMGRVMVTDKSFLLLDMSISIHLGGDLLL